MSDASAPSTKPPNDPRDPRPAAVNPRPEPMLPLAKVGSSGPVVVGPPAEPTDDVPTIISKHSPRVARAEDLARGSLRGRHLAHFELLDPIGVGGMAAVLRARDTQLERIVALKILPPDMAHDAENIRRFHQEARAAAKLDHENIARVFYCGEGQNLHFIAFEYVEGDNLRTILERRGPLPVGEALRYMLQVATGLAHAAERGVVHRDIKPSNIIITPTGRAKLVDMGLARSQGPQQDQGLTQSGVTLGTFDYISPEQALEPRDADVRSDIYSLGCTFYHVLTGQAPVPGGTAAKKLHWHQHVAPTDPRQLNPAVPDEVAAILARMMAKDPKTRYQRAEHLVQHLLVAAQKYGEGQEIPEGVLFVDAPLPNPPATRPLLVAAASALLLVLLIYLLGQPPWAAEESAPAGPGTGAALALPTGPGASPEPGPRPSETPGDVRPAARNPATPPDRPTTGGQRVVIDLAAPTEEELLKRLGACGRDDEVDVVLRGPLLLRRGVTLAGRRVTLRGEDGARPEVRLEYDGLVPTATLTAAFTLEAREAAEVRGLRFVVNAKGSETNMAALHVTGRGTARVEECLFQQVQPAGSDRCRTTSVVTQPPPGESPLLRLERCAFLGGPTAPSDSRSGVASEVRSQDAVALRGAARVEATGCAFGPHATLFAVPDEAFGRPPASLLVAQCSALFAGDGAAFQVAGPCRIEVTRSVFSRPAPASPTDGPAPVMMEGEAPSSVLVRLTGRPNVAFTGIENRYHNLSAYWQTDGAPPTADWKAYQEALKETRGSDNSLVLPASPWAEAAPLKALADGEPRKAFTLRVELPESRPNGGDRPVGVDTGYWGPTYASLPPVRATAAAGRRARVVDPHAADAAPGVYKSLHQAVDGVEPGEVIVVRHSGDLPVKPIVFDQPNLDLVIEAAPGCRPVLTLGDTRDRDVALFRLTDGRLTLRGLDFRLHPSTTEFHSQSVVTVVREGHCEFQQCWATLVGVDRVRLSLVTLADPSEAMSRETMKGDAPRPTERPGVALTGCFARGEGTLVYARVGRPFDLTLTNVAAALAGGLVHLREGRADGAEAGPAQLTLRNVTALSADAVFRLTSGKDGKPVQPLRIEASECLFVPGKVLVRVEGTGEPGDVKQYLGWSGRGNRYAPGTMFEQPPREEGMMARGMSLEQWRKQLEEEAQPFRGRLPLPAGDPPFSTLRPEHLRATDADEAGARPGELPAPTE